MGMEAPRCCLRCTLRKGRRDQTETTTDCRCRGVCRHHIDTPMCASISQECAMNKLQEAPCKALRSEGAVAGCGSSVLLETC